MYNLVTVNRPEFQNDHRWFWSSVVPCGVGNLFFSGLLVGNIDNMRIALLPIILAMVLISGLMINLMVKSYRAVSTYAKLCKEHEAICSLREIEVSDVRWLEAVDSDCVVYEKHRFDPKTLQLYIEEYYVKFFNQTDEMLFNIARGQSR